MHVALEDVSVIRDDEIVLHRVGLTLTPGTVTVVLGGSGEGKTTLARTALGLTPPDHGRVVVDGRDLRDLSDRDVRALRRSAGAMLGGPLIFDGSLQGSIDAAGNLAFPLRARDTPEDEVGVRVDWWLDAFGLSDQRDLLPHDLSAHTRRRLALAAALIAEPTLLVLDEVELGDDSIRSGPMRRAIQDAAHRGGATVLVTTHDLELARDVADTVVVLANHRVVAAGAPDGVLAGVDDGIEFDRRFRANDDLGPDLEAQLESMRSRRYREWSVDPVVLGVFLALAATAAVLTLLLQLMP
ncbi:ATP-binding cassette domain-containing protein [Pseudonocardia alni]|uniref:ATP-binding cassette domain-containing protein n=1 Tax=Pseudonocardia alni TaxID=33907 RepID=UPI0033C04858